MPGVVEDYVKQERWEKQSEAEWAERSREHIPSWRDEEKITARAYEEPREDEHHSIRVRAF